MFQLSITPSKPSNLPSEEDILTAGREVLDSLPTWKAAKTYHNGTVRTLHSPKQADQDAAWHARVSEHPASQVTFDDLWDKLGKDKPEHEQHFVKDIKKISRVKEVSPSQQIWTLYYKFPPPVSPRVFTVMQTIHYDPSSSPRVGMVVSIPIDLTDDAALAAIEEKGIKGRYASVERLTERADGTTLWEMATSSSPGGSIPTFVAENSIPGQIANDVPNVLKYIKENPTKSTVTQEATPAPQAT